MCDVIVENMAETKKRCMAGAPQGTRVSTYVADVSEEDQILAWAEAVKRDLETDHIHLLINNAGIGGGGSVVNGDRAQWDKTFNVCWGGVYYSVRAFLPLLMKANEGHIVNTSSVNGFWASIGPGRPHTAYCAAKFAVKGFTEALMTDLALNAPHIKCSVVMPGHIGHGYRDQLPQDFERQRNHHRCAGGASARWWRRARIFSTMSDDQVRGMVEAHANAFRDNAPTTAAQAATIILNGVREGKWRILVGQDAEFMDSMVRERPEEAYTADFYQAIVKGTKWKI